MTCFISFSLFLFATICSLANPFIIDFPNKDNISDDDFVSVQGKLREISIESLLRNHYPQNQDYSEFSDFLARCSRGIRQTLIDVEKGLLPVRKLEKIGKGGNSCIVTCIPYDQVYLSFVLTLLKELKASGFNGYFLYRLGGFPNPTGREIQYAGVPYCFKIFMMLEAYNHGFNKVLWLDSAMMPLNDPTPLFDIIDRDGVFLYGWKNPKQEKFILPTTRRTLLELTGTDVVNSGYLFSVAFGLKMNTDKVKKLISDYYELVELGMPFLSCFPEEFVLSALIGNPYYHWQPKKHKKLVFFSKAETDTVDQIIKTRKKGYFFYHRHKHLIVGYDNYTKKIG